MFLDEEGTSATCLSAEASGPPSGRVTGKEFRDPTEGARGSLQAPSKRGVFWSEHRVGTKFRLPASLPASIASTLPTCILHKWKGILEGRHKIS